MSERFRMNCKHLLFGVACGLGMLVLAGGQARAGTLEIMISEGGTTFDILDNGPLDTNPALNAIQALGSALVFPDFTVNTLSALTNNPGAENPTGATLTVTGDITRTTGGAAASITISVTDEDYTLPTGAKTLTSNSSSLFTNVTSGDTHSFTSWYNPSNTAFAKDVSSGTITYTGTGAHSQSNSTPDPLSVPAGSQLTYGLTNETILTMAGASAGVTTENLGAEMGFSGGTTVLGTAVIPEPASLAIMLPALPVVIMGWFRHRKARATSAN